MKTISIQINVPDDFNELNLSRVTRMAECAADNDYLMEVWSIEDVTDCVNYELTDEQAREVLDRVERYHDANIGINWDVLQYHAGEVFYESQEIEN